MSIKSIMKITFIYSYPWSTILYLRNKVNILRVIFLLFFSVVTLSHYVMAQDSSSYYSYALGVSEGLSSSIAFNIVKTDNGFVWIATKQGIDMYNGISFKHYNLFRNDLRTIFDGHTISIYRGSEGTLWAFTDSGNIYYYDIRSDSFELFIKAADYVNNCLLNSLLQINNQLYLGLTHGIVCIDIPKKKISHSALPHAWINTLIPYKDHRLLAGTQTGIYVLDFNLHVVKQYVSTSKIDVQTLFLEHAKDEIWIGSNGQGAWRLKGDRVTPVGSPALSAFTVRAIKRLDEHHLLLGSDGSGVFCMDINESVPTLFAADIPGHDLQLSSSSVYDIMVDSGNIWVTTYQGGVTLLRKNNEVRWLEKKDRKLNSENFALGICEDADRRIWVAFNNSIGCYDYTTNNFKSYLNRVASFLTLDMDNERYLWCGGYNSGIYRLNTKTGKVEHYPSLDGNLENDHVYSIFKDQEGDIWLGGLNFRLTRIAVNKDGTFHVRQHYNIKQVRTLCSISKDSLVIGTTSGFYILNTKNEKMASYLQKYEYTNWRGTNFINCMACGENNELWVGTAGGGLLCYNLKSNELTAYTTQEGLPSNYMASMQMDRQGRLWVSTETCGIFVFDSRKKKFMAGMKRNEGLLFNDFISNSSYRLSDGKLAFGGYNGVIVFQAASVLPQSQCKGICFINLTVLKDKVTLTTHPNILETPLNQMEKMKLPYNSGTFTLNVSTNNLYNQSSYQLYYRLKGYETEWRPLNQQHEIMYANLSPGKYTLQIRNSDKGLPDYVERNVLVVVEQTIWLRWYAFVGYIVMIFSLIYWGLVTYKSRMNNKFSDEKIRFFTNVAHDIRNPLSLVSAPLEKLSKLVDKSELEKKYLLNTTMKSIRHLQGMIDQLMDFNKFGMSEGLVHREAVNLKVQLSIIKDAYLPLTEAKGLSLKVEYPSENYYLYTDETLFHRIMDNLLSNALKYTPEGSVEIIVSIKGKYAQIEVKDTGIGISPDSGDKLFKHFIRGENAINEKIAGYGIGLFFTYRLAKLLNGKLSFKSKLNLGTSFYLALPLAKGKNVPSSLSHGEMAQEAEGVLAPKSTHSIHKETILLVDDNEDLRRFLSYALSEYYNVIAATAAEEALQKVQSYSVDLIISDMKLPGMDGNELCRHLKKQLETSHIPIILLTANADKETMNDGLASGMDDYVTKPFDLGILLLKIQNIFHVRKKLRAYYLSRIQLKSVEQESLYDEEAKSKAINKENMDDLFLSKLTNLITENLSNSDFTVKNICEEMAMSRTLLYEKIRKLLGMAPNDLIRDIRMKQAKAWLEKGDCSVASVAFRCGYPDARYFSTGFKNYYGVSPSTIIPKNHKM